MDPGYIPNIEVVFYDEKLICHDYAVFFASMLRSLDIPAKLIKGYSKYVLGIMPGMKFIILILVSGLSWILHMMLLMMVGALTMKWKKILMIYYPKCRVLIHSLILDTNLLSIL